MKDKLKIPVKVWAEVDGKRIESIIEINVALNSGQCRELFFELHGEAMAETVAQSAIKTGWEVLK